MPFHRKSRSRSDLLDKRREKSRSPTGRELADEKIQKENYLRELIKPKEADVDIVAVHGLNPGWSEIHGEGTWTKNNVLWLRDFLPERLPNARVLLFGYNSKVAFDTTISGVNDVALGLLNRLKSKRNNNSDRPIVFVCHSLGGIVVKEALVRAKDSAAYDSIPRSTRGIAFFGTPHRGGNGVELGSILARIVSAITGNVSNSFMETLRKDSIIADGIHDKFLQQASHYDIRSFYETKPFNAILGLIVNKVSATLGLPDSNEIKVPVEENHSNICKFDVKDETYEMIIDNITEIVQSATRRARLSVPAISVDNPYTTERKLSVSSFRSDDSLSDTNTTTPSVSVRVGMPTYSKADLSSFDSPPLSREGSESGSGFQQKELALPIMIMPYKENPNFVGREEVFEEVKRTLMLPGKGQKRAALYGLGGVGKSQIAIKYTYWYRENFPDHSVFWIHGGTTERFRQALLELGITCRVPGVNSPSKNRLITIRDWLERDAGHHWLMIIDNADDPEIFRDSSDSTTNLGQLAGVYQYIPYCEHGTVLITTRDLRTGRRLVKGQPPIEVERMSNSESIEMLQRRLGVSNSRFHLTEGGVGSQQADFNQLSSALDNLPLAMVQAASFIQENSMNISRYLELFKKDSIAIQLLHHEVDESESESGRDSEVPKAVYHTWKLSLTQIQRDNPRAAELLFLMAHYEQSKIPSSLLQLFMGDSLIDLTRSAGVLLRFSLITSGADNSYNMHRLVQLTVKQWLNSLQLKKQWASKALQLLSTNFPNGQHSTWDTCAAFESHAVKIIQTVSASDVDLADLAQLQTNLGFYYFRRSRWVGAEDMTRQACENWEKADGMKDKNYYHARSNLVRILKEEGKMVEAEKLAVEVVDGTKSLLGSKNEQTLLAHHYLALIYQSLDKLKEAERACRKALSGREKLLPPGHLDVLQSQRRLATILELQGKYDAAETLITKALEGHRAVKGSSEIDMLDVHYRLAFIQRAQGAYAASEQTVRKCLALQTTTFGRSDIEFRKSQYSLAITLLGQGKVRAAEAEVLDLMRFIDDEHPLSPNHPYTLYIAYLLGRIRTAQGQHEDALALYRTAYEGFVGLGPDHQEMLEYRSAVGAGLLNLDPEANAAESLALQNEAHAALEKKVGADHPLTLTSRKRVSEALAAMGDVKKALKIAKKVASRRAKVLKATHPDTIAAVAWVEELEGRKKGGLNRLENVPVEKTPGRESSGSSTVDGGKSLSGRSLFSRWSRSSGTVVGISPLDSKDYLPGKEQESEEEEEEDLDSDDEKDYEKDDEKDEGLDDEPSASTTAFRIRGKEIGS